MESGASAPSATLGGTNAMEVGLGVQLDGIDTEMTSGAIQSTGNPLDCAIQGDGFFRVTNDPTGFSNINYTRAGNFQEDANGNLVTQDGYYVVGYALDSTGAPTTTQQTITIPPGTTSVSIGQNGIVTTVDSTGASTPLAAISLAKFPNDAGLAARQRQHVPALQQLGRRAGRYGRHGRPGHGDAGRDRDVERRPGPGVHDHDHRRAWLPGQQPHDHDG